jgi:SPP1 family predicted phage head-tail adaptor
MNPGVLDIPIDIYRHTTTRGAMGGEVKNETLVASVFAQLMSQRGSEKMESTKETAISPARLKIRYIDGITEDMFVRRNGKDYTIRSIEEYTRRDYLILHTEKRF